MDNYGYVMAKSTNLAGPSQVFWRQDEEVAHRVQRLEQRVDDRDLELSHALPVFLKRTLAAWFAEILFQ